MKVLPTHCFSLHVGADADMTNKINIDIDTMNSTNESSAESDTRTAIAAT